MNKLYIIGNGFDLWHNLPTSYECFNAFMLKEHPKDYERIGHIFNRSDVSKLWSDYENMLPKFDIIKLVENNIEIWSNYRDLYKVENAFDSLYKDLMWLFHEWVLQIDYSRAYEKRLALDNQATFLNFNYTNTLERFYGICRKKICYIHGDTSDNSLYQPVIGHGESSVESIIFPLIGDICNIVNTYNHFPQWAQTPCAFMTEILEMIKAFLYKLKKNTGYYIEENEDWFARIGNIENIYVLGHSLAGVDAPYFKRIHNESPKATWHLSYLEEKEKDDRVEKLYNLLDVSRHDISVKLFSFDDMELKI